MNLEQIYDNIDRFFDKIIKNKDFIILDLLCTYLFSLNQLSWGRFKNNKDKFKEWFGKVIKRTLKKKYDLSNPKKTSKKPQKNLPYFLF